MDVTGLSLTTITLFIPMVGLILLLFINDEQKETIKWTAFGASIVTFLASLLMWINFDPSVAGLQMVQRNSWLDLTVGQIAINVSYFVGVDGMSLLLVLLTTFIMPIAILSSFGAHVLHERGREKLYFMFMLLLEWAMIGVFVAHDLIIFYIFWEVTLVPMYFLIGIWGAERRVYAAVKFFLYTMAGSILMLIAILYVGNTTGTFSVGSVDTQITDNAGNTQTVHIPGVVEQVQNGTIVWNVEDEAVAEGDEVTVEVEDVDTSGDETVVEGTVVDEESGFSVFSTESVLFLGFLIAFAIKVPIWPLHSWLPDAHVQAPTAGSVILAGVLLKMGTYGIVRFCLPMFPNAVVAWAPAIAFLGVVGIIYGAWVSYAQTDVKKLVAYSSVSHLGFVVVGIFALNAQGLQGATLQMVNHGISTGGLFLVVGMIYERYHTKDMEKFGGIWKLMPAFGAISLVITLSSMGLPGLNGFVGEFTILLGSLASPYLSFFFTLFATTGVILAAVYLLYMFQKVYQGEPRTTVEESAYKLKWNEIAVLIPVLIMIFWIGLQPAVFFNMIDAGLNQVATTFNNPEVFAYLPQTVAMLIP